jgi:hypothetical protein
VVRQRGQISIALIGSLATQPLEMLDVIEKHRHHGPSAATETPI